LDQTTVSPETFEIPADYERREMDFESLEGFQNTNPNNKKNKKKKKG
jgi:hypothetical protein